VSRLQFKKMVSSDFAQLMSLHAGEAYAMQNLTRTDRLGLLLSGKVSTVTSCCWYVSWYLFRVSGMYTSQDNVLLLSGKVSTVTSCCLYFSWYLFREPGLYIEPG
jgi:hypothetical protein